MTITEEIIAHAKSEIEHHQKTLERLGHGSISSPCSAEVDRLKRGLQDIHDRASGKRGNPKWIVGHIENLLAGREYDVWD